MDGNKLTKTSWIIIGTGFALAFLGVIVIIAGAPNAGTWMAIIGIGGAMLYLFWIVIQSLINRQPCSGGDSSEPCSPLSAATEECEKQSEQSVSECESQIDDENERERQRLADVEQKAYWIRNKLCRHCGGEFEGMLFKKCTHCGKTKDY